MVVPSPNVLDPPLNINQLSSPPPTSVPTPPSELSEGVSLTALLTFDDKNNISDSKLEKESISNTSNASSVSKEEVLLLEEKEEHLTEEHKKQENSNSDKSKSISKSAPTVGMTDNEDDHDEDEDEDDDDDEDSSSCDSSAIYLTKMEDHVSDAIPLKEMVRNGEISQVYTVDINHGVHGKANLVTDPNASHNPAERMKKLNADLRTFQTGFLPLNSNGTGIYIRWDEDDPAYMKCLMTGPEGTPYSWGLFEFDIFIPPNYPQKPPKFTHRTTGNNTIRFNPNLYSNGYVCLSLLGTWDGPSWDPKVGSMVQILNSIQALVLVDDPYYNEPGTSPSRDKVSARQYVHMVREATIRHAIAGQLGKPSSIWKSVILDHFALTKGQIYEMAAKWVEEAPEVAAPCGYGDVGCKGIRSTMREAYREMQMAFDKLTFVKYLNDFESKFYPEDGEYDDDDEDIDDEDTDDEDEMKEESKQSEEKEDQEKLFLLELALKDPSIPMSKKQLKKLSQEDRQRRQEVEEEQYMNTLYQMCLKDASILNLFPSRVQKNEDFLKRVLAGNCQLLQYVSSVELMLKLIDSLPLPTEAMKIISLPEKEESKNNNSHNNNNNNTFSTFSFNPAPVSNAKSQYAFDFDYSESSEDSDVDENENLAEEIDYEVYHKLHPDQKVAHFLNYNGSTYKRLSYHQFGQAAKGNVKSIKDISISPFASSSSSSSSSTSTSTSTSKSTSKSTSTSTSKSTLKADEGKDNEKDEKDGKENEEEKVLNIQYVFPYYKAKVTGAAGISIEDSPELSSPYGTSASRILPINEEIQVLCEVEDKHKNFSLVKTGRRVLIAVHNVVLGYASMHTSDNVQLIEIIDPCYKKIVQQKKKTKQEKEKEKELMEKKKKEKEKEKGKDKKKKEGKDNKDDKEDTAKSTVETLLETVSSGLADMDLVKDFIIYKLPLSSSSSVIVSSCPPSSSSSSSSSSVSTTTSSGKDREGEEKEEKQNNNKIEKKEKKEREEKLWLANEEIFKYMKPEHKQNMEIYSAMILKLEQIRARLSLPQKLSAKKDNEESKESENEDVVKKVDFEVHFLDEKKQQEKIEKKETKMHTTTTSTTMTKSITTTTVGKTATAMATKEKEKELIRKECLLCPCCTLPLVEMKKSRKKNGTVSNPPFGTAPYGTNEVCSECPTSYSRFEKGCFYQCSSALALSEKNKTRAFCQKYQICLPCYMKKQAYSLSSSTLLETSRGEEERKNKEEKNEVISKQQEEEQQQIQTLERNNSSVMSVSSLPTLQQGNENTVVFNFENSHLHRGTHLCVAGGTFSDVGNTSIINSSLFGVGVGNNNNDSDSNNNNHANPNEGFHIAGGLSNSNSLMLPSVSGCSKKNTIITMVEVGIRNLDSIGEELVTILSAEKERQEKESQCKQQEKKQVEVNLIIVDPILRHLHSEVKKESKLDKKKVKLILNPKGNEEEQEQEEAQQKEGQQEIEAKKDDDDNDNDTDEELMYCKTSRPEDENGEEILVKGKYLLNIELQVPEHANPYKDYQTAEFLDSSNPVKSDGFSCIDKFQLKVTDNTFMTTIASYASSRFAKQLWIAKEMKNYLASKEKQSADILSPKKMDASPDSSGSSPSPLLSPSPSGKEKKDNVKENEENEENEEKEDKMNKFKEIASTFSPLDEKFMEECNQSAGLYHFAMYLDGDRKNLETGKGGEDTTYDWDIIPNSDNLVFRLKSGSMLSSVCFPTKNPFSFNVSPSSSSGGIGLNTSGLFGEPKHENGSNNDDNDNANNKVQAKFVKKAPDTIPCIYGDENSIYSYEDDEEVVPSCEMTKINNGIEDDRTCDICNEDIVGGHYTCYSHDVDMCAKCYYNNLEYETGEVSDEEEEEIEKEEEEELEDAGDGNNVKDIVSDGDKALLHCKVMNPLRRYAKASSLMKTSTKKNDEEKLTMTTTATTTSKAPNSSSSGRIEEEILIDLPAPSHVFTSTFGCNQEHPEQDNNNKDKNNSDTKKREEIKMRNYPSQLSLSKDMCVTWNELTTYDLGKKKVKSSIQNNNPYGTMSIANLNNLCPMFKRQILLSLFYQSLADAKMEFEDHNRSYLLAEKEMKEKEQEKEKGGMNSTTITASENNKEKEQRKKKTKEREKEEEEEGKQNKQGRDIVIDYDSEIIDITGKIAEKHTFQKQKEEKEEKERKEKKKEEGEIEQQKKKIYSTLKNLNDISLNLHVTLFDGVEDYLQATTLDPSLKATKIRFHDITEYQNNFLQVTNMWNKWNPTAGGYGYQSSNSNINTDIIANYLPAHVMTGRSIPKSKDTKLLLSSLLENQNQNQNSYQYNYNTNTQAVLNATSLVLLSMTKCLRVGGSIEYGKAYKQQLENSSSANSSFAFNSSSYYGGQKGNTAFEKLKQDMNNNSPPYKLWQPPLPNNTIQSSPFGSFTFGQSALPTANTESQNNFGGFGSIGKGNPNPNPAFNFTSSGMSTAKTNQITESGSTSMFGSGGFGGGLGSTSDKSNPSSLGGLKPFDFTGMENKSFPKTTLSKDTDVDKEDSLNIPVTEKKMTYQDQYHHSSITKYLGTISIGGEIYPMYNFHECCDLRHISKNYYGNLAQDLKPGNADIKSVLSLNNISQLIKEIFFMKEYIIVDEKDENTGKSKRQKICMIEMVNKEISDLCAVLEKRGREVVEEEGKETKLDIDTPLWTDEEQEQGKDKLSLHSQTISFLKILSTSLRNYEEFRRYEIVDGEYIHH